MKYRILIINNGISSTTKLLLNNGRYKPIKKIIQSDILINQYGNQVNIKKIIFKGQEKIINIYNEAWNDVTKISKNQRFYNYEKNIIAPPYINWDLPKICKYKNKYVFGFIVGFLLGAATIIEDNRIVFFLKKKYTKEINKYLADYFGIQNIICYEGEFLTKYVIKKEIIPLYIYETIKNKSIDKHIMISDEDYIYGMARGINQYGINIENILYTHPIYLNELCNWINIILLGKNNNARFYIEDEDKYDDIWDIETEDNKTSFIANNMIILY
jgi:hypothetical protein